MITQWLSDDNKPNQGVQNYLIMYLSQAQTHTSYSLRSDSEIQCYVCWIHTIMFKSRKKESDLLMTLTLWSEYNSSISTACLKRRQTSYTITCWACSVHWTSLCVKSVIFCSLNISMCEECYTHVHNIRILHFIWVVHFLHSCLHFNCWNLEISACVHSST